MKGFGMGTSGQGRMTTHQQKKLDFDDLKMIRDRFRLPLTDEDVEQVKFYKPADNSPEMQYLHARRAALGGYLPRSRRVASKGLIVPPVSSWGQFALDSNGREMSTTMALVRVLGGLGFGAGYPNALALVNDWVPARVRTYVIATLSIGIPLGTTIAAYAVPPLLPEW